MVVGYTVDAALARLRKLQLRWPNGRVAHAWPARDMVDTIAFAPFESTQAVLVRVRKVHRMAPEEVIEIEVTANGPDRVATSRAQTDHLRLVTDLSLQAAEHLEAGAVVRPGRATPAELVTS
jgi:hypothetical protein